MLLKNLIATNKKISDEIEEKTQEFLAKGNKINKIPACTSVEDVQTIRERITGYLIEGLPKKEIASILKVSNLYISEVQESLKK